MNNIFKSTKKITIIFFLFLISIGTSKNIRTHSFLAPPGGEFNIESSLVKSGEKVKISDAGHGLINPGLDINWAMSILNSVIRKGILSSGMLRNKGFHGATHHPYKDEVCGVFVNQLNIKDKLYNGPFAVMPVIIERPNESISRLAGLSPEELAARAQSSICFVIDRSKLKKIRTKGRIPFKYIEFILCPEEIFHVVKSAMPKAQKRIIKIGYKKADIKFNLDFSSDKIKILQLNIPDYESGIRNLLNQNPTSEYWIHGMRLPTKMDAAFLDNFVLPSGHTIRKIVKSLLCAL